jgi:hypothetical protein
MEEAKPAPRHPGGAMNEYLILEMMRQRSAEQQEAARLARQAREQRAANRRQRAADRAQRVRDRVLPRGGELADLPQVPDYVDGSFAADQPASAGRADARR